MRVGSLFSGYGGLDLAVLEVLGGSVAWHAELDPAPARILAHHWPAVPNLGDVAAVDWAAVEPVDVLTGGFPCQDVSAAGRRAGMTPGTRSGLWSHMAAAVAALRPSLVVVENVRGLLSATAQHPAHRDVEPCPWCMGDDAATPLRALGAVLGDLSDLGYDARWCGLRAADVGAPHGRFRVFLAAMPADALRPGRGADGAGRGRGGSSSEGGRPDARRDHPGPFPDAAGNGRGEGWARAAGELRGPDAPIGGGAAVHAGSGRHRPGEGLGTARRPADAAADPDRIGRALNERGEPSLGAWDDAHGRSPVDWGDYELAVRRWERRLGRPAPAPAEPGPRTGRPRLAAPFVEWLMGLDAGHVTAVPGLTRNDQLRALGNGVVPQQAAAALRQLLAQ